MQIRTSSQNGKQEEEKREKTCLMQSWERNEHIEIMNKTVGDLELVHYLCSVHYK